MPRPLSHRACTLFLMLACPLLAICANGTRPASPTTPAKLPSPLALSCMTCHAGPDTDRNAIDLHALPAERIATALHAFRDGERDGTVMPRLARALNDEDIARLSQAFRSDAP